MKKIKQKQKNHMSYSMYGLMRDVIEGRLPQLSIVDNRPLRACLNRGYLELVGSKTVHATHFGVDEYDRMRLAHAATRNKSGPLSKSVLHFAEWRLRQIHMMRKTG